jgi:hypothetical protein
MTTASRTTRTHLTPLGKLLALVFVLSLGAIAGAAGVGAARPHAQAWRCISVRPGETLWSIAEGNPAPDRRETVQRILDHNGLATPPMAGQSIWVPNEGDMTGLIEADSSTCPGDYS